MTDDTEDDASIRATWEASEDPSSAVVETVATATDRDPPQSWPPYEYVEADVLDRLLRAAHRNGQSVSVTFEYDGAAVVVDSDGNIEISLDAAEWA